jgi:hypothetical protein
MKLTEEEIASMWEAACRAQLTKEAPSCVAHFARAIEARLAAPGLQLDPAETAFLAARLRRLFQHFGIPVTGSDDDARLIGNAGAGIGLLLGRPMFSAADVDEAARFCGISDGHRDLLGHALRDMHARGVVPSSNDQQEAGHGR